MFALIGAFVVPLAGIILGHLSLSYMKKADKNIEEAQTKKTTAFALMSAADKRKEALEVKPKINLALKM